MSRARELAKVGGKNQQVIAGLSSHVGVSTFAADVFMYSNLEVTGTTTFNGGTLTLGDAASDNVVFGADVNSHIIPNTDDTYDLGSSTQQWRDFYLDGTANIDTLSVEGTATFATALANSNLENSSVTVTAGNALSGGGGVNLGSSVTLDVAVDDSSIEISSDALRVKASGITNNMLAGSIANAKLAFDDISFGGVSVTLGGSDATPAFNLEDATGLPISSGVSGLSAGVADFLGNASSNNLRAAVTGETGSGGLVFANTPTLTSPTINTPDIVGACTMDDVTLSGNMIVGAGLTVTGSLDVQGTVTTINSTTVQVDDKNLELGTVDSPSDTTANGGGIVLKGGSDHSLLWYNDNDHWESSEHFNLVSGKAFQIADTSVLNATTLGSGVVNSSLTSVGTLSGLTVSGNILPNANGTLDIGASGTRFANVFTSDLDLSNEAKGVNSVDGTWGSYLIEEGENDLYITNRRSGKRYRFMMEEV